MVCARGTLYLPITAASNCKLFGICDFRMKKFFSFIGSRARAQEAPLGASIDCSCFRPKIKTPRSLHLRHSSGVFTCKTPMIFRQGLGSNNTCILSYCNC